MHSAAVFSYYAQGCAFSEWLIRKCSYQAQCCPVLSYHALYCTLSETRLIRICSYLIMHNAAYSQRYHAQCCALLELSCTMLQTLRVIIHNAAYFQRYHAQCCALSELSCTMHNTLSELSCAMLRTLRDIKHNAAHSQSG